MENKKHKYRENKYFNTEDTYSFYDIGLKKEFTSKVALAKNGSWHTVESLQYKCTSIPCYKL